ncbi:MAG: phenylalanine--tRNA ligase subunit beta [Desulfamplus sp.]|nr:phenylalanine--tRNA ligase subunit beta [Desulfamplus sp.]
MKFTLSWLKEYTSVEYTPSEIADKLTMAGLEVDSFENRFAYLDKVVISRVEHVSKHPSADNLTCCKVNIGNDEDGNNIILNIVCGAPNVREGLVVPCALIGATLPGDIEIKKSKLRGEISEGMLCSFSELRLNPELDRTFAMAGKTCGIMELDSNLIIGTPIAKALNLDDYLFEVDLTPNRADCLSVIGIAREVAAFSEPAKKLNLPFDDIDCEKEESGSSHDFSTCHTPSTDSLSINNFAKVKIFDPDLCPRYTAGMLIDVTVGPSPFWLQDRLLSVGLTPINNIVDITNFVMMETGQPLHAFDYENIAKGTIEVKRAGSSIEFKTLDSKAHTLDPDMLMICDGDRPVGIAGVMGGENSEILNTTTKVFVESACFNAVSIRRTAKQSGINTDASHRFERGVDPAATKDILKRAIYLMAKVSGGKIVNGIIDENPIKHKPTEIVVNTDSLNSRLGTTLSYEEIKKNIESVGFKVTQIISNPIESLELNKASRILPNNTNDTLNNMMLVTVPSFRVDVTRAEDISEEVARLWGYNNIQTSFPKVLSKGKAPSTRIIIRDQIKDIMNGFGFSEVVNYSFTSASACDHLSLDASDERRLVEDILNPISEELSVLRTSLIPGLLENMRRNNSQQIDSLRLFEVGKVFIATRKGWQPIENEMIAGLWTGLREPISWSAKPADGDFFDTKGVVQGLCSSLGLDSDKTIFEKADQLLCPYYQKGQGAIVKYSNKSGTKLIGSLGKINNQVLRNFGLKQDAFIFEMDMETLLTVIDAPNSMGKALPLPKFPSLSRDMTLILDSNIEVGAILSDIFALKENLPILEDIFMFDLYEGKPLAEGKKSISMRIVYRSWETTLTEKMISGIHADISKRIMEKYGADLP